MTDFEIEILEKELSELSGTHRTIMCRGGPECMAKAFSTFVNGAPGKPHFASRDAFTTEKYHLRYGNNTRELFEATIVGVCDHTTLNLNHKRPTRKQREEREDKRRKAIEAVGGLREVIVLFGSWLKRFQQVWELTTDNTNKEVWEKFKEKMDSQNWGDLIAFIGTDEFENSVKKLKGETKISHDQRIKNKALMCVEAVEAMLVEAKASHRLTPYQFGMIMIVLGKTRANLMNRGYGPESFLPLRSTRHNVVAFLDAENDPVYTETFRALITKKTHITFDELMQGLGDN